MAWMDSSSRLPSPDSAAEGESIQRLLHLGCIAFCLDFLRARNLAVAHLHVVDFEDIDLVFLGQLVLVHADDHVLATVDARLLLGGGGFDLELGPAAVHGLVMPPMASTSSMIFQAASAMSCVSFSIM